MKEWFKNLVGKKAEPEEPKKKPSSKKKSPKEIATEKGEPYIEVITLDIDANNPSQGAFELEWNEFFVKELRDAGYQGTTDEDVVDIWFQSVCRNVAMAEWEEYDNQVGPNQFVQKNPIGEGRSEIK